MLDNIYVIIAFAALTVIFAFAAAIVHIRNKQKIINTEKQNDFLASWTEKKKKQLKNIPGAISFKTYIRLMLILPILIGLITWFLLKVIWISVLIALTGLFIPEFIVKLSENKQKKNFEERYARALRHISSSLRSGMTLQQAVEDLCKSQFIHYQIKKEFRQVDADIKMGISVPDAFDAMAERMPTDDVKDVASAIRMQSLVGGSEAESIEIISMNISSRLMLKKEIKTLFANVRMTIIGMDLLPVFVILFLYISSPTYFQPLFSSTVGIAIFIVAVIMMVTGSLITRRFISRVKGVK